MSAAIVQGSIGVILMYHRIAEISPDPWQLAVSPRHFAEQMDILVRELRIVRLDEIAAGRLPADPWVAITFDDAYSDTDSALRSLAMKRIPASLFVPTAWVGRVTEFWWDEIQSILLSARELPSFVSLRSGTAKFEFDLGMDAVYETEACDANREWTVLSSDPTRRHTMFRELHRFLLTQSSHACRESMQELRLWAGVTSTSARGTGGPMTHSQLADIAALDCVTVGSHTVNHAFLPALPDEAQMEELRGSMEYLQAALGAQIQHIAYPYGAHTDATIRMAHECGYKAGYCVGNSPYPNSLHSLPRLAVFDWDGEEFRRQLKTYLDAA